MTVEVLAQIKADIDRITRIVETCDDPVLAHEMIGNIILDTPDVATRIAGDIIENLLGNYCQDCVKLEVRFNPMMGWEWSLWTCGLHEPIVNDDAEPETIDAWSLEDLIERVNNAVDRMNR